MTTTLLYPVLYLKDSIYHMYQGYVDALQYADPRSGKWALMSSPMPTLALIAIYLTIVRYGPILMKDRKPFALKWTLVVYNLGVMLLNLYIATELVYCGFFVRGYNWFCQLVDTSSNEYELRIAKALWLYFFSKLIEFCDTIFFILRKKDRQLTFLHVYHHSTMFGLWWIGVKWVPGGSAVPGAIVNGYVHVLMYLYYGLSAMGPVVQKFLWWKKYITIVQLIQFAFALSCGLYTLWINCKFTKWMQYAFVTYALSFIVLFGNFYLHAYINKDRERRSAQKRNGHVLVNGTSYDGKHQNSKEHHQQNGKIHYQSNNSALRNRINGNVCSF